MESVLLALGGTTVRFGVIAVVVGLALFAAAWNTHRVRSHWFVVGVGAFLLACRWPLAALNIELGVDESQALAGAVRLSEHLVPWKYVDLNTVGPVNILPMVVLSWLGIPLEFSTSHFLAVFMVWIALAGAYRVLCEDADERVARCGILPAVAFFALTTFPDFTHLTSEHVPMALIGVGFASLWQGVWRGEWSRVLLGTTALGAIPWAKLQAVPLALWFCLAGGVIIVRCWRNERPRLWRLLGAWLGGGVLVSVLFGIMILIWGLGRQWYVAYIQQAFSYTAMGGLSFLEFWRGVPQFTRYAPELRVFAIPLLVFGVILSGVQLFAAPRHRAILFVLYGAIGIAAYIIAAPGRQFFHYLLLGVIPLCMIVAALLDSTLRKMAEARPSWFAEAALAVFLAATLVPQVRARMQGWQPGVPYLPGQFVIKPSVPARVLAAAAQPGDTMSIWGWVPKLHVESGVPQATRDAMTERQITANPLQDFYRSRYMVDLHLHRPRFFVEAVGPEFFAYHDRAREGFESWPELREYVLSHYELACEIDSCRIFVRKPDHVIESDGS